MKRRLIYLFTGLLVISLAFYAFLPRLAQNLIEDWLTEQGFQDPTFTINRPSLQQFSITQLKLSKQADNHLSKLELGPIKIFYNPLELLLKQRLKNVEITASTLNIKLINKTEDSSTEQTQSYPDINSKLPLLLPGQWFNYLPADSVTLHNFSVNLQGDDLGDYHLSGNLELTPSELTSNFKTFNILKGSSDQTPLLQSKITLTKDNRFNINLNYYQRELVLISGQLSISKKRFTAEVLSSLSLDTLQASLNSSAVKNLAIKGVTNSHIIRQLPKTQGSLTGKTTIELPIKSHTGDTSEDLLAQLNAKHQSKVTAQIDLSQEKHLTAKSANIELNSTLQFEDGKLLWLIAKDSKVRLFGLQTTGLDIAALNLSLKQAAKIESDPATNAQEITAKFNTKLAIKGIQAAPTKKTVKSEQRYPDIDLHSQIQLDTNQLKAKSSLKVPKLALNAKIHSTTTLPSGNSRINWSTPSISLPDLQRSIAPYLDASSLNISKEFKIIAGKYQQSGTADWRAGRLNADIQHRIAAASIKAPEVLLDGIKLNSTTKIDRKEIKQIGTLHIDKVTTAVDINNINSKFTAKGLSSKTPSLELTNLSANLFEGSVQLAPFTTALKNPSFKTTVNLQGLSLNRLFELQNQPELTGKGRIKGLLPVTLNDNKVSISEGVIESESPGVIAYKANAGVQAMAASNMGLNMAIEALEDFHYQRLSAQTEYRPNGELHLKTRLQGANPTWNNGRAIDFSINVEQNLLQLFKALNMTDKLTDKLETKYGN